MKNIRTILLLSATCLTIMGAETSFASLNGASLLDYKGASATSTSICNHIIPSPKGNVKSHTHLVAASPSPHLSSSNWPQTQSEHRDSSAPISLAVTDARGGSPLKLPQLASVCFITDAGNCSGIGGAGSEDMPTSSGGPEDWELDSAQRCREEGYVNTICPEGASSGTPCPYDSNWHSGCICADTYNKSCTGSDQQGKGESCNGLYQECCNLCSDYPYTASNLPTGYVKGASCNSCSGTKYKAQCDSAYKYACTYNYTGHISGGSGTACDGKYKSCKCMSGYTWNASTGTCDISCDPAFDLTCTRSSYTHITGGDGSACDGKYQRCKCESGYTWNPINNQCEAECDLSYNLDCLPNSYTHILGGEGSACGGKYQRCKCESGYTWVSSGNYCEQECNSSYKYECTPSYSTGISGGSGSDCNGKYTACRCISGYTWNAAYGICEEDEPECDSSYKYTCTGSYQMTGTSSCDGKYQSCRCISGYTWNTAFGICEKDKPACGNEYKYSCMYSNTNHIIGGVGSACNGKYTACRCETGYTWNSSTETCGVSSSGCGSDYKYTCTYSTITHILSGSGISCGGKYKACTCMTGYEWNPYSWTCEKDEPECDSSYKYLCNIGNQNGGKGQTCGGLYKECNCAPGSSWNGSDCVMNSSSSGGSSSSNAITVCFSYKASGVLLFNGQISNRTNWTSGCHKIPSSWCLDSMSFENSGNYTIIWEDDRGYEIARKTVNTSSGYGCNGIDKYGKSYCNFSSDRPCLSTDDLYDPNGNFQVTVQ